MQSATTTLWDWLALSDEPQPSDLIFLFGGSTLAIPRRGLWLYQHSIAQTVICNGKSGTFGNPEWDKPEANMFADFLIEAGVPKRDVLIQNHSTNTMEDVVKALAMFKKHKVKHKTVTVVSRPVHQRRAFATYLRHDPHAKIINVPCAEAHPGQLDGMALTEVALRCVQEYDRLITYAAQDNLVAQEVPAQVEQAYRLLIEQGELIGLG